MVTTAQRHKLNRRPLIDPLICLVEFQADGESEVYRATTNNANVTRDSETYIRSDISVTLPKESVNSEVSAKISMSNVTRAPGRAIAAARRKRIGVRLIVVHASDPDTAVKIDTKNLLYAKQMKVSSGEVEATLASRVSLNEPVPPSPTENSFFPGLFFIG